MIIFFCPGINIPDGGITLNLKWSLTLASTLCLGTYCQSQLTSLIFSILIKLVLTFVTYAVEKSIYSVENDISGLVKLAFNSNSYVAPPFISIGIIFLLKPKLSFFVVVITTLKFIDSPGGKFLTLSGSILNEFNFIYFLSKLNVIGIWPVLTNLNAFFLDDPTIKWP